MFTSMRSAWARSLRRAPCVPSRRCSPYPRRRARPCWSRPFRKPRRSPVPYVHASLRVGVVIGRTSGAPGPHGANAQVKLWPSGKGPPSMPVLAGRSSIPRREELPARTIQLPVVAVDVAQIDPRADHVVKLHPSLLQQGFGKTEHAERLFVGICTGPAEPGSMEPDLLADVDPQAVSTGALGTAAGGPGLNRFESCRRTRAAGRPAPKPPGRRVRSTGVLDLGRGRPVNRPPMCGENPMARLTDGLDVCPQIPQEDCFGND